MTATYPHAPGFKGESETGSQAAAKVASKAAKMRENILDAYKGANMTHDECAELLRPEQMSDVEFETFKRSVRSRCSELKVQGRLEATSERRENASGHAAVVWSRARTNATQQELI